MKLRIAALALCLAFIATPGPGIAAIDSCPPCCAGSGDVPCGADAASCEHLAATPCCDVQPVAPIREVAQRSSADVPNPPPAVTTAPIATPTRHALQPPRRDADLALRTSPLQLSVVLLI